VREKRRKMKGSNKGRGKKGRGMKDKGKKKKGKEGNKMGKTRSIYVH